MSAVTVWIAGDFEKVSGRKLLFNALKHMVRIIYSLSCSLLFILSTHHLLSIWEDFEKNDLQMYLYVSCVYVCCCLLCVKIINTDLIVVKLIENPNTSEIFFNVFLTIYHKPYILRSYEC